MGNRHLPHKVGEILDYPFDWTSRLESGETISSVSTVIVPTGEATIDSGGDTQTAGVVTPFVTGVVLGHTYRLDTSMVTNQGRTDKHSRTIRGVP